MKTKKKTRKPVVQSQRDLEIQSIQQFLDAANMSGTIDLEEAFSINSFRTNRLLREDEWKAMDDMLIQVTRHRLNGIKDLMDRNLIRDVGGLGVLVDEWEAVSDIEDAEIDMSMDSDRDEDSVEFTTQGVPIPIISKGYRILYRRLLASRKKGVPIDTTQTAMCGRKVRDALEKMLFYGASIKSDNYTIPGYTTFDKRVTLTINGAWGTTPANIIGDVESALTAMDALYHFGPYVLYIPTNYWSALRKQENQYHANTYLDRVKNYAEIEDVKPADVLGSDELVLVEMNPEVVDLAVAQDITNIEWSTDGKWVQHMKVMAAMAPRLKHDANDTSGILHGKEGS